MAKKRKHRPRASPPGEPPAPAARQAAARRAHKEEARRAREAAAKRARRSDAVRRSLTLGVVVAIGIGAYLYLTRAGAPGSIPEAALAAAEAAGCDDVRTPAGSAPAGDHVASGQPILYEQRPATSGQHYGDGELPADPHVRTEPVDEGAAVHNLEHAYVLIYYRAEGKAALPDAVVQRLATLAESEDKVIMAPYPQLDEGTSLALAAWNKLWECPSTVTPDQARTIAKGFIDAYRGTSNAPEPQAG